MHLTFFLHHLFHCIPLISHYIPSHSTDRYPEPFPFLSSILPLTITSHYASIALQWPASPFSSPASFIFSCHVSLHCDILVFACGTPLTPHPTTPPPECHGVTFISFSRCVSFCGVIFLLVFTSGTPHASSLSHWNILPHGTLRYPSLQNLSEPSFISLSRFKFCICICISLELFLRAKSLEQASFIPQYRWKNKYLHLGTCFGCFVWHFSPVLILKFLPKIPLSGTWR